MSLFARDAIERVVRTFLATAVAVVVSGLAGVTDLDGLKGLAVCAVASGASAALALLTKNVGDPETASVIPRD
jgi:hypothetical protein